MTQAELFQQYSKLLYKTVHEYSRRHGGDVDELISDAMLHFLSLCRQYRHERAAFSTWLCFKLPKLLASTNRRPIGMPLRGDVPHADRPAFDTDALLERLSSVARQAVAYVLDMPPALVYEADARGGAPRNFRAALRALLMEQGYTGQQISQAFAEIRAAL